MGAEEENQVCSLIGAQGRLSPDYTYYGDDRHCCLQRVYVGVCLHRVVRPSLSYTGHGHCLSLELDMFRLFPMEHSFLRGFLGHKDVGFFSSFVS